jgi:two-component system nitrogen regulation sensor histidine kinase GlnL
MNILKPSFQLFLLKNHALPEENHGKIGVQKEKSLVNDLKIAEKEIGEKSVLFILSEIFSSVLNLKSKINSSIEILRTYLDLEFIILHYRDGKNGQRFISGKEPENKRFFTNLINTYSDKYDSKRGRVYFLDARGSDKSIILLELVQKQKVFGFIALPFRTGDEKKSIRTDFYKTFAGIFAQGIMIDLTISRLRNIRNFNNNILESMTSGLICFNNLGMITRINRSSIELIFKDNNTGANHLDDNHLDDNPQDNYSQNIIGKHLYDFVQLKPFVNIVDKSLYEDMVFSGQEVSFNLRGQKAIFGVSTSTLKDNEENKIGVLMIFRDLTRIQNLKKKLIHREKLAALGEMAAKVAHEIKNPLTSIRGFIELISKELPANAELKKYSGFVFNEVDYLVGTLDDLLRFTKASEPTSHYKLKPVHINQLVNDLLFIEKFSKRSSRVIFKKKFTRGLPDALVEPEKLKRVIVNLIINSLEAFKFSENTFKDVFIIKISSKAAGNNRICIKVTDNGPGIPFDIRNKIFSPFFTTKCRGTGLGLAICERVIAKMKGSIRFRSIKGLGTCFEIMLSGIAI